jgi:hypothetical protein
MDPTFSSEWRFHAMPGIASWFSPQNAQATRLLCALCAARVPGSRVCPGTRVYLGPEHSRDVPPPHGPGFRVYPGPGCTPEPGMPGLRGNWDDPGIHKFRVRLDPSFGLPDALHPGGPGYSRVSDVPTRIHVDFPRAASGSLPVASMGALRRCHCATEAVCGDLGELHDQCDGYEQERRS